MNIQQLPPEVNPFCDVRSHLIEVGNTLYYELALYPRSSILLLGLQGFLHSWKGFCSMERQNGDYLPNALNANTTLVGVISCEGWYHLSFSILTHFFFS
jgi:hypothetical protein